MKRQLRIVLLPLAFTLILLEEVFWAIGKAINRLPLLKPLDWLVDSLPARFVVLAFLLPVLALLPVKFGALWLIASGHPLLGICMIIAAKIGGTAISSRILLRGRDKLLSVALFARVYGHVQSLLQRAHAWVETIPGWYGAKTLIRNTRESLRSWFSGKPGLVSALRRKRQARPV